MIHGLRLQHMRLYTDETFEFDPGVNIIIGPNASGKTTIIEALSVLTGGSSYKSHDGDMVQHDNEWMRIDATFDSHSRVLKLQKRGELWQKTLIIDDKPLQRMMPARMLPYVLFEPDQLQLITTQPDLRRSLIDDLIVQTKPQYATMRKQYKRLLAQRNALLKREHTRPEDYFVWNLRLSEFGGAIVRERLSMLNELNKRLGDTYSSVAGAQHTITMTYAPLCDVEQYETDMLRQLELRLDTDKQRGYTTRGPHRDDVLITLNEKALQTSASRGEIRTLLLALKVTEALIIEETRDQKPLLLLDDVFGELDGKRRHYLTDVLQTYQTFITTTDADVVVGQFGSTSKLIPLG